MRLWVDHLSSIYVRVRKMVDIDARVEVMNKRLDVLEQLLEILRAEKSEQVGPGATFYFFTGLSPRPGFPRF